MLYLELAIVIALMLLNGLLAMAELAIVSSRRARLQAMIDRDVVGSRRALALASDPGKFLSPSSSASRSSACCPARFRAPRSGFGWQTSSRRRECRAASPTPRASGWWSRRSPMSL